MITKSWHFKVNFPSEGRQEVTTWRPVNVKPVMVLKSGSRTEACCLLCPLPDGHLHLPLPKQVTKYHQRQDTPWFPDVQSASPRSSLLSGARHQLSSSVCMSSFDRNAFIYSPITIKSSSAAPPTPPPGPNYLRLFLSLPKKHWTIVEHHRS